MNKMRYTKLVIHSTKSSLNDRFSVLKHDQPMKEDIRGSQHHRELFQASRRNQRIAADMDRRPAVKAALQKKKPQPQLVQSRVQKYQPASVKNRLAVRGRLSRPSTFQQAAAPRGRQDFKGGQGKKPVFNKQRGNGRTILKAQGGLITKSFLNRSRLTGAPAATQRNQNYAGQFRKRGRGGGKGGVIQGRRNFAQL